MKRCKTSMYNHFAALIPIPASASHKKNSLNHEIDVQDKPWWLKVESVNGYDTLSNKMKAKVDKNKMNKVERKKFYEALTFHYLKNSDQGTHLAAGMSEKLEKVQHKEATLAAELNINVEDLDLGVSEKRNEETIEASLTNSRNVTTSYETRNWLQRATIIFLYLHPKIGAKKLADVAAITGVNEHTLSGWVSQKKLIACWLGLVEAMNARTALSALPSQIQDVYCHVDPESTVSVDKYKRRIGQSELSQLKILFKGGNVST